MSTVLGALREVLHTASWDSKSSLHNGCGLASPAALLIQHIMCLRGADDDLSRPQSGAGNFVPKDSVGERSSGGMAHSTDVWIHTC